MVRKNSGSMSQRSIGGEGAAAAASACGSCPEVAAVEALAAALPLRMSTQVLRTTSQERRGELHQLLFVCAPGNNWSV
jgi:hypothetical protein